MVPASKTPRGLLGYFVIRPGLVSSQDSQWSGIRGSTHHSREAGPAGRGPSVTPTASPGCVNGLSCQNAQSIIPHRNLTGNALAPCFSSTTLRLKQQHRLLPRFQLLDPQTSTTVPAPPRVYSSTNLKLQLQHQLLPGSPAPQSSNYNSSTGSSPGLQLPDPQTSTATLAPPQVSRFMILKLQQQHRLLPGSPAQELSDLRGSTGSSRSLQLPNPKTTTAAPAPPWISSSQPSNFNCAPP
ncbi:uncharacterized protein LOC118153477 [Callithrix jacchus]